MNSEQTINEQILPNEGVVPEPVVEPVAQEEEGYEEVIKTIQAQFKKEVHSSRWGNSSFIFLAGNELLNGLNLNGPDIEKEIMLIEVSTLVSVIAKSQEGYEERSWAQLIKECGLDEKDTEFKTKFIQSISEKILNRSLSVNIEHLKARFPKLAPDLDVIQNYINSLPPKKPKADTFSEAEIKEAVDSAYGIETRYDNLLKQLPWPEQCSPKQKEFKQALTNLKDKVLARYKADKEKDFDFITCNSLTDSIEHLVLKVAQGTVTTEDVQSFDKETQAYRTNKWLPTLLSALIGAALGFVVGFVCGGFLGVGIGAAAGAAVAASAVGLFAYKQDPIVQMEGAASRFTKGV